MYDIEYFLKLVIRFFELKVELKSKLRNWLNLKQTCSHVDKIFSLYSILSLSIPIIRKTFNKFK